MNGFRTKLSNVDTRVNLPLVGMGVMSSDGMITDALCDSVDWLWFDMEHNCLSPESLRNHIFIAHGRKVPCFVRIGGPNHIGHSVSDTSNTSDNINRYIWSTNIKQVIDMGCDGIVVPEIRNAKDVISIVNDCKYPIYYGTADDSININKHGYHRGFSKIITSNYGRNKIDSNYVERLNNNIFIVAMIETAEALMNIDEICNVDELDGIMIGMGDFKAALKLDYSSSVLKTPKLLNAVDKIIQTAKKYGKYVIFSTTKLELAKRMINKHDNIRLIKLGDDAPNLVKYTNKLKDQLKSKL